MADATTTTWASALFEMRGVVQEVFSTEHVLLAELNGAGTDGKVGRFTRDMDKNRTVFSGSQVRHTIIPYGLQGGGFVSETGTWNVPHALNVTQVTLNLKRTLVPFSISVDVERDSLNNSNYQAVAGHVKQARIALAKLENLALNGDGTGLQVDITDGATSLTTTCGVTANFDVLLPGTVWDIRTRATGADPGQGLRRLIASVNETTRVITWSTTAQASDGGSGNIVHTSADGIYMPGSYGNVPAGIQQAAAITGTFQGVDKATNAWWQGTDGRGGDTTVLPLSDQMLDAAVRRGRRWGIGMWNFGVGDPAAIAVYKNGKLSQVRYEKPGQGSMLRSGFSGVAFEGGDKPFPLIGDPMHKKGAITLIRTEDLQLYGDQKGPDFLDDDGGMFRRFTRSLPKEADLLDRWQLGVKNANGIVTLSNLATS